MMKWIHHKTIVVTQELRYYITDLKNLKKTEYVLADLFITQLFFCQRPWRIILYNYENSDVYSSGTTTIMVLLFII